MFFKDLEKSLESLSIWKNVKRKDNIHSFVILQIFKISYLFRYASVASVLASIRDKIVHIKHKYFMNSMTMKFQRFIRAFSLSMHFKIFKTLIWIKKERFPVSIQALWLVESKENWIRNYHVLRCLCYGIKLEVWKCHWNDVDTGTYSTTWNIPRILPVMNSLSWLPNVFLNMAYWEQFMNFFTFWGSPWGERLIIPKA